jgi:signal transduction histidine kinase
MNSVKQRIENIVSKFIEIPNISKNKNNTLINSLRSHYNSEFSTNQNDIIDKINNNISLKSDINNKPIDFNLYLKMFIHELRTPISTISMGLNILETKDKTSEELQIIKDLNESIKFLENIFNKCLQLIKINVYICEVIKNKTKWLTKRQ